MLRGSVHHFDKVHSNFFLNIFCSNILQTFLSEFKVHWTQLTASGPVVASFDAFQNSHFDFAAFALSIMCGVRSATQISHFQEPDPVSPAQLAATDSRTVSDLLPTYLKE